MQSLFDQHYRGLRLSGLLRTRRWRQLGLGALHRPVPRRLQHCRSVLLTELLFPDHSRARWLGQAGVIGAATAFTFNAAGIALFQTKLLSAAAPQVSLTANLAALAIAGVLIVGAFVTRPATRRPARLAPVWVRDDCGGLRASAGWRGLSASES